MPAAAHPVLVRLPSGRTRVVGGLSSDATGAALLHVLELLEGLPSTAVRLVHGGVELGPLRPLPATGTGAATIEVRLGVLGGGTRCHWANARDPTSESLAGQRRPSPSSDMPSVFTRTQAATATKSNHTTTG